MTGSRYRVMTPGNMTCYSAEGASYSRTNQGGDPFRLGGGEQSCSTRCLSVGPRGFRTDLRKLDPVPAVHPAMLRVISTLEGAPNPTDLNTDRQTYNRLHDILQKDVSENKDILNNLNNKKDEDIGTINHWNMRLSVLVLVPISASAVALFFMHRKGASCG